jgi:hypothetical protein
MGAAQDREARARERTMQVLGLLRRQVEVDALAIDSL